MKGDKESVCNGFTSFLDVLSEKEMEVVNKAYNGRNQNWIEDHLTPRLQSASKTDRVFIAIGYGHLFDYEKHGIVGLKTLLERKGFKVVNG